MTENTNSGLFDISELLGIDGTGHESPDEENFFDETGMFDTQRAFKFVIQQNKVLDAKLDILTREQEELKRIKRRKEAERQMDSTTVEPSQIDVGLPSPSNDPSNRPFVTYEQDGETKDVYLSPQTQFILQSTTIRQSMTRIILRHYHSIHFLRNCTISGSSRKRSHDGIPVHPLPIDTKLATIAIIQKLAPSKLVEEMKRNFSDQRKLLSSTDYHKAIKEDVLAITSLIKKSLSYFYHQYTENGILRVKTVEEATS